jgi:hypothetical protein
VNPDSDIVLLPRVATLDGFVDSSSAGVHLPDLAPLTRLRVRTRNTSYLITVAAGCRIYVEGGRYFPTPIAAVLEGCSAGGSLLKIGCIAVGLCMEITVAGQRILTSPVRAIDGDHTPASRIH